MIPTQSMGDRLVRLTLRRLPYLVPEELRDVPPEELLGRGLRSLRRRFGLAVVRVEEIEAGAKGEGHGCEPV